MKIKIIAQVAVHRNKQRPTLGVVLYLLLCNGNYKRICSIESMGFVGLGDRHSNFPVCQSESDIIFSQPGHAGNGALLNKFVADGFLGIPKSSKVMKLM